MKSIPATGMRHEELFTITIPAHESAINREHSWQYEWVKSVAQVWDNLRDVGREDDIVVTVDFATGPPQEPRTEGSIVIKSYQSGGEILRIQNGEWHLVGHQPPQETMQ